MAVPTIIFCIISISILSANGSGAKLPTSNHDSIIYSSPYQNKLQYENSLTNDRVQYGTESEKTQNSVDKNTKLPSGNANLEVDNSSEPSEGIRRFLINAPSRCPDGYRMDGYGNCREIY